MNNLRAFKVKFIHQTNFKPSRIKITDCWYDESVIFSKNEGMEIDTVRFLTSKGIFLEGEFTIQKKEKDPTFFGYKDAEYFVVSKNFTNRIK
jgi:hypothetical protein